MISSISSTDFATKLTQKYSVFGTNSKMIAGNSAMLKAVLIDNRARHRNSIFASRKVEHQPRSHPQYKDEHMPRGANMFIEALAHPHHRFRSNPSDRHGRTKSEISAFFCGKPFISASFEILFTAVSSALNCNQEYHLP